VSASTLFPRNDEAKVQPYLKNTAVFTSPADSGSQVSILFNDQLTGRVRKTLEHPERLIMLYYCADVQPLFRYGRWSRSPGYTGRRPEVSVVAVKMC
jgi:hypothetical protein